MSAFANIRMVLPDMVLHGSLTVENGVITNVSGEPAAAELDGAYLIPGIIDLHTDNLERQVLPRSNARWPSRSAFLSHDAQCAAAGITTVFDALCLGDIGFEKARVQTFLDGVADLHHLNQAGLLKAEHFLHLRCELPAEDMPELLDRAIDDPYVRLISLMDHSPGMGQYADISRYQEMRVKDGFSESEIADMILFLQANHRDHHEKNRRYVLAAAGAKGIPVASHDDRMAAEIARNHEDRIKISEFPVSLEAARAASACGMAIIAGAPNIVRGGSHSGNVAVLDLISENLLDALASDYVPAAMLEAVFCAATLAVIPLPAAIGLITAGPAAIANLSDRGRIAAGLRADLVQVQVHERIPVIRAVWRQGQRIA